MRPSARSLRARFLCLHMVNARFVLNWCSALPARALFVLLGLCSGGALLGRLVFGSCPVRPGSCPVRARFVPGSSPVRARIAHGSRTDRARIVPRFVHGSRADRAPVRARFVPGSCPARARFVHGSRTDRARIARGSRADRARIAPGSCPAHARFVLGSCPVRARFAPSSCTVRARFAPGSCTDRARISCAVPARFVLGFCCEAHASLSFALASGFPIAINGVPPFPPSNQYSLGQKKLLIGYHKGAAGCHFAPRPNGPRSSPGTNAVKSNMSTSDLKENRSRQFVDIEREQNKSAQFNLICSL